MTKSEIKAYCNKIIAEAKTATIFENRVNTIATVGIAVIAGVLGIGVGAAIASKQSKKKIAAIKAEHEAADDIFIRAIELLSTPSEDYDFDDEFDEDDCTAVDFEDKLADAKSFSADDYSPIEDSDADYGEEF